jgi:hypothetical protein
MKATTYIYGIFLLGVANVCLAFIAGTLEILPHFSAHPWVAVTLTLLLFLLCASCILALPYLIMLAYPNRVQPMPSFKKYLMGNFLVLN